MTARTYILLIIIFLAAPLMPQDYLVQQYRVFFWNWNWHTCWRLSSEVTWNKLERQLFSAQSASEWVRIKDETRNPPLDFTTRITLDPAWQRIIFSDYDRFIKSYGDHPGEAQFDNPHGICRSPWVFFIPGGVFNIYRVKIYVADSGNNRIVELNLNLKWVFWPSVEFDGSMEFSREFTGAASPFGPFNYPMDVAYQPSTLFDGYLWVTDTGNHRVVKIRLSDGEIVASYGEYGSGQNRFVYPTYLDLDTQYKQLYLVDSGNGRLVKLNVAQAPVWINSFSYSGRYLYGVYADPLGKGVWAADGLSHSLVRYDEGLNELFAYGDYGLGQVPGKLNAPKDVNGYYISRMGNSTVYTDLLFATEKWTGASGQTHYQVQPRYIPNSFTYRGIWRDPGGGGGGIWLDKGGSGEPAIEEDLVDWLGTWFSFKVSEICRINATIYNEARTEVVEQLCSDKLIMPGKVYFTWGGRNSQGGLHTENSYFHITVKSIYDPQVYQFYEFLFNPLGQGGGMNKTLSKTGGEEDIPQTFRVFPNYPNPFNSTTHIRYQLPERGKVTLEIYNVLGQRVRTLVNEAQAAGVYTVEWDGRNGQGVSVGSGVYFCRVRYKSSRGISDDIKKLLLVK